MKVRQIVTGALGANCYLVWDEVAGRGVVVDPGDDAGRIVAAASETGALFELIVDTHCHPDHTGANCAVREGLAQAQGVQPRLLIHSTERGQVEQPPLHWLLIGMRVESCRVDGELSDGDILEVGETALRVLHLPGHSAGSVALVASGHAFTGDVLFAGSIGRTDLPGGDAGQMADSLARLVREVAPETVIWPGHGPSTTLAEELATNPWLTDV